MGDESWVIPTDRAPINHFPIVADRPNREDEP